MVFVGLAGKEGRFDVSVSNGGDAFDGVKPVERLLFEIDFKLSRSWSSGRYDKIILIFEGMIFGFQVIDGGF